MDCKSTSTSTSTSQPEARSQKPWLLLPSVSWRGWLAGPCHGPSPKRQEGSRTCHGQGFPGDNTAWKPGPGKLFCCRAGSWQATSSPRAWPAPACSHLIFGVVFASPTAQNSTPEARLEPPWRESGQGRCQWGASLLFPGAEDAVTPCLSPTEYPKLTARAERPAS